MQSSQWSVRKTVGTVLGALVGVLVINGITVVVLFRLGFDPTALMASAVASSELSTHEVVRSIAITYGGGTMLLLDVLLVPVVEETVFRGVFLSAASRYIPFVWANTVQAAVFTLWHDHVPHYPALFVLGLLTGVMRKRSGGLAPAIALHASTNLLAGLVILGRLQ